MNLRQITALQKSSSPPKFAHLDPLTYWENKRNVSQGSGCVYHLTRRCPVLPYKIHVTTTLFYRSEIKDWEVDLYVWIVIFFSFFTFGLPFKKIKHLIPSTSNCSENLTNSISFLSPVLQMALEAALHKSRITALPECGFGL